MMACARRRWAAAPRRPPFLGVTETSLVQLPELAPVDQLPGQAHRREEPVVETHQVLDPGGRGRLVQVGAVGGGGRQWLFADDVLARGYSGQRGLDMGGIGGDVVKNVHRRVGNHVVPVRRVQGVPIAGGRLGHAGLGPAGHGDEYRAGGRGPAHMPDAVQGVRVGPAHKPVTEQAKTDGGAFVAGSGMQRHGPGLSGTGRAGEQRAEVGEAPGHDFFLGQHRPLLTDEVDLQAERAVKAPGLQGFYHPRHVDDALAGHARRPPGEVVRGAAALRRVAMSLVWVEIV